MATKKEALTIGTRIPHQEIEPYDVAITMRTPHGHATTGLKAEHITALAMLVKSERAPTKEQKQVVMDLLVTFAQIQNPKAELIGITPDGVLHTFTD